MPECTFRALGSWYSHSGKQSYKALAEALPSSTPCIVRDGKIPELTGPAGFSGM